MRTAVVGASGFVGSAASRALRQQGIEVIEVQAPRLVCHEGPTAQEVLTLAREIPRTLGAFREALTGAEVIINAAGLAAPGGKWSPALVGANAILPVALQEIARDLAVDRYIHVSSAAVQGRRETLDQSMDLMPFSPYSASKALAEEALVLGDWERSVIYRPTSVHGVKRSVTRTLVKLARSPYACVAGAGNRPTPQVLDANVGCAIAFLARTELPVPSVVLHPWEGHTTSGILSLLGRKEPHHIPETAARRMLSTGYAMSTLARRWDGQVRRLEMLLMGQGQMRSWLDEIGWCAPHGADRWAELAALIERDTTQASSS